MQLEHYPVEKLKKEILEIAGRHLNLKEYRLFFFGSRVSSQGNETSDIDVGIEGPAEIPAEIMGRILEDLEKIPTLYKIEAVDFKKVPADFKEVAMRHIELIVR